MVITHCATVNPGDCSTGLRAPFPGHLARVCRGNVWQCWQVATVSSEHCDQPHSGDREGRREGGSHPTFHNYSWFQSPPTTLNRQTYTSVKQHLNSLELSLHRSLDIKLTGDAGLASERNSDNISQLHVDLIFYANSN